MIGHGQLVIQQTGGSRRQRYGELFVIAKNGKRSIRVTAKDHPAMKAADVHLAFSNGDFEGAPVWRGCPDGGR